MPKTKQTPGIVLDALLKKHDLNYNRLAKAIGLSSAMVRLIARDENPISASVAFRFAKFFKTKPEYWLMLQMESDNAKAAGDKKLAKALKDIPTVDKATFERKPRTTKTKSAKKSKKAAAKPKTAAKTKSPAPKKAAKRVVKKTAGKQSAQASKKTAVKAVKAPVMKKIPAKKVKADKAQPASKPSVPVKKAPVITVKPEPKPAVVQHPTPPVQQSSVLPETKINEPKI
jgi:addiction module HigA family antidote